MPNEAIDSKKRSLVQHDAFEVLPPGEILEDAIAIQVKWLMQQHPLHLAGSTNRLKNRLVF
jgi:hypothetical protein